MRTPKEVAAETKELEKLKSTLPEFTLFGDNNWKTINMQIDIINGNDDYENYVEADTEVEMAAYDAEQWLMGEIDSLTKEEF